MSEADLDEAFWAMTGEPEEAEDIQPEVAA